MMKVNVNQESASSMLSNDGDCNAPVWQQLLPMSSSAQQVRIDMPNPDNDELSSVETTSPTSPDAPNGSSTNRNNNKRSWMHFPTSWNNSVEERAHPSRLFRHQLSSTASSIMSGGEEEGPSRSSTGNSGLVSEELDSKSRPSSPLMRYRSNRWSSRRVRKRVVMKNGECNVVQSNVAKRRRRYLADIFTTMVDIQWRWTVLIFTASFILSWLAFAVLWWLISFTHGDLEPEHLPGNQDASGWKPCIYNVHSFASCFLFSIETQHTIGYGARYTTEECPEAIFVMCIQSIIGVMIQAFMVGVVFSKLTRPKMRAQTLLFSRSAAICQRDGQLCLMFRVGDMRKSHIIDAHIRAQMIRMRVTDEGEIMPYYQHELKCGVDHDESDIFLIWPMTIVHKITPDSPLYNISASDLLKEKFEIVVILEGTVESTSMTTQARSSYLPSEIKWGHRFEPLVSFRKDSGQYAVDYSLFNNTYEVDTPLCSSKDLDEFKKLRDENQSGSSAQVKPRPLVQNVPLQLQPPYNRTLLIDPTLVNSSSTTGTPAIIRSAAPAPLALAAPGVQHVTFGVRPTSIPNNNIIINRAAVAPQIDPSAGSPSSSTADSLSTT